MTELDLSRNSGNPTEGLHLFKITKVEEKASMSSGNPQLVLTCVCQDQGEDLGTSEAERQVHGRLLGATGSRLKLGKG